MTDSTWISGGTILDLLKQTSDEVAACEDIDNGVALRTITARYARGTVDRSVGGRQALKGSVIKPKMWKRIRRTCEPRDVLNRRELKLPAAEGEPATVLRGLEFDERQVRSALAPYGVPDLPPPPVPKEPRKRSGGHNMGAHGAVISSIVIELLNAPIDEVRAYTELSLAEVLATKFKAFDEKREHISDANRTRMARHLLANVLTEMERRASHKAAV